MLSDYSVNQDTNINDLIQFALSERIWISREMRIQIKTQFPIQLVELLDTILHDSSWPAEPWTTSKSLTEAAQRVEPTLRKKYPELTDESISCVLNYACYEWK
jgi:hypothetical protein